ncbi:MAG TPA: protein kinase [Polyangiaceae bacterium]|nr:protein kinase [Polyangiaceae bacterium]
MLANSLETYSPPRHLGRYELIAPLGEGGMARVYVAVQRGPIANKLVVIKLLREQFTSDEHFVAMFADESRIAVLLNHPNVIHTYESSSTGSEFYIVMEFLEGKTLGQLIRRVGRETFPLETHLWVLCEILAGLHYAHELQDFGGSPLDIVHRDVSPSNILVTIRGEVKLLDFGIAKVQGSIAETQHGIIKGKLGYASPEQCMGTKADGRADIYSVGVMLWEALAGKRRPLSETAMAGTRPGAQTVEVDIAETLPGVPLPLARIVRRALARDPGERYQTARAFELDLRKYLVDRGATNTGRALKALVTGYFGGELAQVRRAIDEQVGSIRHSMAPEPLSVRMSQNPPGSEAPHNIGVTAAPRAPTNRVRQLATVGLCAAAFAAGGLWFSQTSKPTAASAPELSTALGAARPAESVPAARAQAQLPAVESNPSAQTPSPSELPSAAPKPRAVRGVRADAFAAALKTGTVPAAPVAVSPAPIAVPLAKEPAPVAPLAAPAKPGKAPASAEPGVDLKPTRSTATARPLDERDPYAQ